ncbi:ribulose-phosphate 3-epimerase [Mycoplasmoides alvi]|uniref:ribulose-phosphate 3-epimerase n=1 Tax=Mycoplasmoides alvi TaxID=78580 RepID=UPI00051C54DD|nr:ribulose-phosphate 3-epimerase [Mycoplasmoides alvi]
MVFDFKNFKKLSFSVLPLINNFDLSYLSFLKQIGLTNIHYDVMDEFTGTKGFDTSHLDSLYSLGFKVNVHLMVKNISLHLTKFINYPFDGISFHVEPLNNIEDGLQYIKYIKNHNKKAGIAFKFDTNFDNYLNLIANVDYITLMSVIPGTGGQKYNSIVEDNLKKLQLLCEKNNIKLPIIEFDGGITSVEIKKLWPKGNVFVTGSWFHNLSWDEKKEILNSINSGSLWNPFNS